MEINFNNRDPVYLQVIRFFKEQIATGKLVAGQEIPSRRELATLMKINPNTAQKAYKEMEELNLITTEKNFPSKITTDSNLLNSVRDELIGEAVSEFVNSVKTIGVSLDELIEAVKHEYETNK
ncbi:MAG: GntR family transcriptional regulator [Bacillales bacterium]|nr:GntR family transcriptional regulator [Bacillales bacterium]